MLTAFRKGQVRAYSVLPRNKFKGTTDLSFPLKPSTSAGTGPLQLGIEEPDARAKMEIKVQALVNELEKEADRRVTEKRQIEKRWIEESYQFAGRYLKEEEEAIKSSDVMHKSSVYMNLTRQKTDAMEARLYDIAFPTDDRPFSIAPTPVPRLSDEATAWAAFAAQNQQNLLQVPEGDPAAGEAMAAQQEALARATAIQAEIDEARRRSEAMQDEMDDQLKECSYNKECRSIIHDACKLGTGVMKGPVLSSSRRKSWNSYQDEESGFQVHEMVEVEEPRPAFYRVDPWNWFPDMDAVKLSESESFFERHLMTSSALRNLAKTEGFNQDAIRRLLKQKPKGVAPQYMSDLRSIVAAENLAGFKDKYHVWEYHGPIEPEDMHCLSAVYSDAEMGELGEEYDPLQEINVTVWFCQGEVLKFGIHPLDSGEPIYSVFNLKKDDHSIFGFGVPHLIADSQKVVCAAWRMMVDNANIATGPQIVINKSIVEPEDGDYTMYPLKIWLKKSGTAPGDRVFETYHLDIRQVELANIIELATRAIDQESGIPMMTQGEPGVMPTQTALGISILNNSVNVLFRAVIKQFDDDITVPNIRRLYDWNMQFSEREDIKGDMEVHAKGTSTFMLRELQAPALMTMLMQFAAHPVLGPALQVMPMARKLAQSMLLPQNEVIKSDEKLAADLAAAAASEEQGPTPEELRAQTEQMKAQALVEAARLRFEAAKYTADSNRDVEMIRLEMLGNTKLDELDMKKTLKEKELESKERQQAADIGLTARMGRPTGGGWA